MPQIVETEIGCRPLEPETVSPAAQVMIDICHELNCYYVPLDSSGNNYADTNLDGLGGKLLEELPLSDLEKVVLLAAGFERPPEFVRERMGILQVDSDGQMILCLQGKKDLNLNQTITEILKTGKDIVGIRVTPAHQNTDTKPSRPFQKIIELHDGGLIFDDNENVVGIYQRKDPDKNYVDPYLWQPGDTVQLYPEPKAIRIDDIVQAGGFILRLMPEGDYQAYITNDGIDVRYVHDSATAQNRQEVVGKQFKGKPVLPENPIIKQFLIQNYKAIQTLQNAIKKSYPNYTEMNIQANYAFIPEGLVTCALDMEIPEKISAQWLTQLLNDRLFPGGYNQAILELHLKNINERLCNQYQNRQGD